VSLRVPAGWTVQSVDGIPAGAVARWSVAGESESESIATLHLSRPAFGDSSIVAQIRLHGPNLESATSGTKLTVPRLRPMHVQCDDELVTVRTEPPWTAELAESSQVTVVARTTAATGASSDLQLRFDGLQGSATLGVHHKTAEFSANLTSQIDVSRLLVAAQYEIALEWPAAQPDAVNLQWTAPAGEMLRWELPQGVQLVRLEADDASRNSRETWRIRIDRSGGRRARLIAHWRASTDTLLDVPIPTVLDAAASNGVINLKSVPDWTVRAESSDLTPVSGVLRGTSDRDEGRYDAWRYGKDSPTLRLHLAPNQRLARQDPWVSLLRLHSNFDGQGDSFHTVHYQIRNGASYECEVQLPPQSTVRKVLSQGATIAQKGPERLAIKGPNVQETWELSVEYSIPVHKSGLVDRLPVPIPHISLPVAQFAWDVNPPPGYMAVDWPAALTPVPPFAAQLWDERLFGWLLRSHGRGVFRFWNADSWRTWWALQSRSDPDGFERRLQESVRDFVEAVRAQDRTWFRLCAHLSRFGAQRLVLDVVGMERAGIDLSSAANLSDSTAAHELFGLASSAHLNLVRSGYGLLLTTRGEANRLARPGADALRMLRSDAGLAAAIEQAMLYGADSSGRFVRYGAVDVVATASAFPGPDFTPLTAESWHFEGVNAPAGLSLTIVRSGLIKSLSISVILFGMLLAVGRKTRPRRSGLFILIAMAATGFVLAVLVPQSVAPLFASLGWTAFIVLAAWSQLPLAVPVRLSGVQSHGPSVAVRVVASGMLLFLLLPLGVLNPAHAQDGQGDNRDSDPLLAFIPFDPSEPEKRHEASRVLLPSSTYERLLGMAKSASGVHDVVLFRATSITGQMTHDRLDLGIDVELQVLGGARSSRVLLPLNGLVVRSARINGEPCSLEPGPGGLYFATPQAGRHRLHLDAVLAMDAAANSGVLDLMLPPAPQSRMELRLPAGFLMEVESAVSSELLQDGNAQRLAAELSSAGRFVARWSRVPRSQVRWRADVASLFTWRGLAASLEVRSTVMVDSGALRTLVFEPDPRLALQNIKAPGMTGYWRRSKGGKPQWIVEFERPIESNVTVVMECLMRDGATQPMSVPEVHVIGAQSGVRLLGIRGDGGFGVKVVEPREGPAVAPGEFVALWRETLSRAIDFTMNVTSLSSPVVIERTETLERANLQLHVDLRAARGRVDVLARAVGELAPKGIRHELALPEGLTVRDVRASPGTHWTLLKATPSSAADDQSEDPYSQTDHILWFGVPTGDQPPSIEIDGWVPRPEQPAPMPLIRRLGNARVQGSVVIWRARDLNVVTEGVQGMHTAGFPADQKPPSSQLVADGYFEMDNADVAATWHAAVRVPKVATAVATRLLVDDAVSEWIAVVDCQISDGAIQTLEVNLQESLPAEVQLSGERLLRHQVIAQGESQLWRIVFEEPQWHSFRLMLRARLTPGPDGNVIVPVVVPQNVVDTRQFLLVLNATEHELAIRGVEGRESVSGDTFAKWFTDPITRAVSGAFKFDGTPGGIHVQPVAANGQNIDRVASLERHRVWMGERESIWIESSLLVRARSSGDLAVALPADAIAYDTRINGRSLRPTLDANGRILVHLPQHDRLHEVMIRWRWDSVAASARAWPRRVEFPRLMESDCPATWTVYVPPRYKLNATNAAETCASALAVIEAQSIAAQLEYLIELPRASDDAQRAQILGDLENSLLATTEAARQSLGIESEVGLATRKLHEAHEHAFRALGELTDSNRRMVQRLSVMGVRLRAESPINRTASSSRARVRQEDGDADGSPQEEPVHWARGKPYFFMTNGSQLSVELQPASAIALGERAVPALLAGIIAGWIGMLFGPARAQSLQRCMMLAAIGVFWCWKLSPDPVGPALLLVAAVWSFFVLVRRRRYKPLVQPHMA
jgi:hypothetical protein